MSDCMHNIIVVPHVTSEEFGKSALCANCGERVAVQSMPSNNKVNGRYFFTKRPTATWTDAHPGNRPSEYVEARPDWYEAVK